jgi:hypothetical protein
MSVVVPGLADVRAAEEYARAVVFCDVPVELCGVEVMHLTPQHLLHLTLVGNPFAVGGAISPGDVLVFLHAVSARYPHGMKLLVKTCASLPYKQCVDDIKVFIDDAMADGPGGGTGDAPQSESVASDYAGLVHLFAKSYGWSRDQVMRTPYAELWQYYSLLVRDADPKAPLNSRVLRYARKYLAGGNN